MTAKQKTISEQLKDAILSADKTRYRIVQETGLTEASLSRFVNGVCGLSLDSIDKIGTCLELEITIRKQTSRTRKGK